MVSFRSASLLSQRESATSAVPRRALREGCADVYTTGGDFLLSSSSAESLGQVFGMGSLMTAPWRSHTGQDTRARLWVVLSRKTTLQARHPTRWPSSPNMGVIVVLLSYCVRLRRERKTVG